MFITPGDLAPFADIPESQALAMIEDAEAMAVLVAPCIADESFTQQAAAKAILRRAILRWWEAGTSGTTTQETTGPFSTSVTSSNSKGLFWPSEIGELQKLCSSGDGKAFTIKPAPSSAQIHGEICSLRWFPYGHCTCGSDMNRYEGPIFGETA